MNIVQIIRSETRAFAGKPAIVEANRQITYGEFLHAVDAVAADLQAKGVGPAQRVALLANDSIDYVVANLAVLSLQAVAVPISPVLAPNEIQTILESMSVHHVLSDRSPDGHAPADAVAPAILAGAPFTIVRRTVADSAPAEYHKMNAAFIRFSSGTTGASKGVLLSHESILQRTDAADKALRMTSSDVVFWLLSMSYHFVVSILLFLRKACTIVLCEQNFPAAFFDSVARHKGTFAYGSPFHYHVMTTSQSFSPDSLSAVRMAICTAVRLPPNVAAAFHGKFGFPLSGAYGIIEIGLPFVNTSRDAAKAASAGKILPDFEHRIANPGRDGIGEILLRGKGMFDAYFSPWQTRAEALHDGWFDTGDLGKIDPDGFLHILGRKKEIINFAGMKIFPQEVEEVLIQYPAVDECLVYGEPHPAYGHLPCARIVIDSRTPGDIDINDLRRFCYQHLASYKVPKKFEIVDRLEKTASNKLRRRPTPTRAPG